MEVRATRTIPAPPERIFAFLEAPDRHWELLGRRLEPLRSYDGRRSQARLRGPLGIRRTLWIELATIRPPAELTGRVTAGGDRTVGTVLWVIRPAPRGEAAGRGATDGAAVAATSTDGGSPADAGSTVELTARTDVVGPLDRMLLVCGGALWLRQSLEHVLVQLDRQVAG
jgi:hypothetical protein